MDSQKTVASVANGIVRRFGTRNPERIAKAYNIIIKNVPFAKQKGAYKVLDRQPIIFIKEDLHPVMRKIVLAHEIGHHVLHRKDAIMLGGFNEFNLFDMRESRMEYEANMFAAHVLIKDEDVLDCIENGFDVEQIARTTYSDINLVALKVSDLNSRGYHFREQEHDRRFLR